LDCLGNGVSRKGLGWAGLKGGSKLRRDFRIELFLGWGNGLYTVGCHWAKIGW